MVSILVFSVFLYGPALNRGNDIRPDVFYNGRIIAKIDWCA